MKSRGLAYPELVQESLCSHSDSITGPHMQMNPITHTYTHTHTYHIFSVTFKSFPTIFCYYFRLIELL